MQLPTLSTRTGQTETVTEQQLREAVRAGVREAFEAESRERESGRSLSSWLLLGLVVGATVYLMRRRSGSVGEAVDEASQRVQQVTEETGERTERMGEETADRIRAGGRAAGEMSGEAAERVEEGSEEVGDQVAETGEEAADRMDETTDSSEEG